LGCLRTLFERAHDGIPMEDALQALSEMLAAYASQELYEIDPDATHLQAGRELREWIKRRLVVEREGRIYATDALESAIQFVDSLDSRIMTSTASRLSVVQREIENLETGLNPSPTGRIASLRRRIQDLEHELAQVEAGHVVVLDEAQAIEGIREVYNLATSLRAARRIAPFDTPSSASSLTVEKSSIGCWTGKMLYSTLLRGVSSKASSSN